MWNGNNPEDTESGKKLTSHNGEANYNSDANYDGEVRMEIGQKTEQKETDTPTEIQIHFEPSLDSNPEHFTHRDSIQNLLPKEEDIAHFSSPFLETPFPEATTLSEGNLLPNTGIDVFPNEMPFEISPEELSLVAPTFVPTPSGDTQLHEMFRLAWDRALKRLEPELNSQVYLAYLSPLVFGGVHTEIGEVLISAPSNFLCAHVQRDYSDRLAAYFHLELEPLISSLRNPTLNRSWTLRFSVDEATRGPKEISPSRLVVVKKLPSASSQTSSTPSVPSASTRPFFEQERRTSPPSNSTGSQTQSQIAVDPLYMLGSSINARYTFDNFVVGNSNQFCHAAAMRVAELPGQSYNPLFIYGGVGLGKTHLLHSIGNAVLERNPSAQILYMSSEAFTNELILALRNAKMDEFKKKLRNIEVLLIDDIQFISGKERTQEEFFHTFNALYGAKRQIVITSDRISSDIPGIEERLQTRFCWGLTADLQAPDFETRVAILNRKASIEEFYLPEDVAHLIAERVSSNVRELEGALTRLHAVSTLQNIPITVKSAQSALKAILQPKIVHISVEDIKRAVANHFSLKVSDIISKRRTKNLSFPRHIAMYLCRKHTTASYPEIGTQFGGRDHSSVIHAASVVSQKVSSDAEVKTLVEDIERRLSCNS